MTPAVNSLKPETNKTVKIARLLATSVASIAIALLPLLPALAIDLPDGYPATGLNVLDTVVYSGSYEAGDMALLARYAIEYAVLPDETATEAFIVSFIDLDGITVIKSVAPYAYVDDGYGSGAVWLRLTASEITDAGIVWGGGYRVRIDGNPALDWGGDPPSKLMTIDSWINTDVSTQIADHVLTLAQELDTAWAGAAMTTTTTAGIKLSSAGETYFQYVIPNCRTIAPDAFSVSELEPEEIIVNHGVAYTLQLIARSFGSPFDMPEMANALGMRYATGNVTVTNGSNIVNGSGTYWEASYVGQRFMSTDGDWYFVSEVDEDGQTLTINPAYAGATLANQTYVLANSLMLTSILWVGGTGFFLFQVAKITKSAKACIFLADICFIGGVLLGALVPELVWGIAFVCALMTLFVIFYKQAGTT